MEYRCEDFNCKRGELVIRGTLYRPEGENLPAVILSHGFKANESFVEKYARALASWGYAAFTYDFCGGCSQGRSDGDSKDMSVLTECEDLIAVMEDALSREYVDAKRLVLMGCSQGGFVSALVAARMTDKVGRLVLFYPAFCIPDAARKGEMAEVTFDPADIPETMLSGEMLLGRRYAVDVQGMEPWKEISGYRGPVLIVHGTQDEAVDISYARKAYETYQNVSGAVTGHPKIQLVELEGAVHGFSGQYEAMAIEALRSFMTTFSFHEG